MKLIYTLITPVFICLLFTGCDSKKKVALAEPVFGIYKYNSSYGSISLQLYTDSTATLDIRETSLQKNKEIPAIHNEGTFSCYHDSLFIRWENGRSVRSKFEKDGDRYSFRVGSTRYERNL